MMEQEFSESLKLNWVQFKYSVPHMSLASAEIVMTNIFVTKFSEFRKNMWGKLKWDLTTILTSGSRGARLTPDFEAPKFSIFENSSMSHQNML